MHSPDQEARPARGLPLYTTLLCLSCVLILVTNAVFLLRNLDGMQAANALQAQTAQVNDELQHLNLIVTDAESSLRGYFLSGSEVYLGAVDTAPQRTDNQLRALGVLLAGQPTQMRSLAQLRALVQRKLGQMQQSLEVYRRGGLADIATISANADNIDMDEIRLQIVIMTSEQNELLAQSTTTFYQEYRRTMLVGLGINAVAIAVILLFYQLIRRSFRLRLAAEDALQRANDRLESMVAERTEQLSVLSRHLIRVSEEEKSRLARELHDEMGANLTAIGMDLATVGEQLRTSHPDLAGMLARARSTLVDTVQLKRRIIENLRPSLLDNMGLSAALQSYCADYARVTGVECDALVGPDADAAGPMQSIALFRIAQEALNNVAKYAQARSVIVSLGREDGGWSLEVVDDGIGIAADAFNRPKSHGLLGMRERALLLGGKLVVERGINGVGTCVRAFVPVAAPCAQGAGEAQDGEGVAAGALSPLPETGAGAAPVNAPHP